MFNLAILNQGGPNGSRVGNSFFQLAGDQTKLTSHPVNVPAGTTDGDITIYCISISGFGTAEVNGPGALTLIKHRDNTGDGNSYSWYSRIASSEPASYSFTTTISTHATIMAVTYRGPTTATAGDLNLTFPGGDTVQADSMTTSSGVLLSYFCAYKASSGSLTIDTEPTGLTQIDFTGEWHNAVALYEKLDQNSSPTDNHQAEYSAGTLPVGLQIMLT